MYLQRNIGSRSRNHCCSGKAISITCQGRPGSLVGVETGHGLDGPRRISVGAIFFAPFQVGAGSKQPSIDGYQVS